MQDTPFQAPTAQQALPFLWRDTATHRLMLATLLATLENALLLTDSATRTLEDWSRTHSLAPPPPGGGGGGGAGGGRGGRGGGGGGGGGGRGGG
ncbi:MAG: hypothetical protein ABF465_11730, partial [Acetobacter orientalis]